jgi:hypothetical protein
MIYETDTGLSSMWNGSAWRIMAASTVASGSLLQTVVVSDTTNRNTTSNYPTLSGFTATITPKSSSSKILVSASISFSVSSGSNSNKIVIAGLSYGASSTTSIYQTRLSVAAASIDWFANGSMSLLHEPATTSICTYNVLYGRYSATYDNTCTINGDASGVNGRSTIILQEIAG